MQRINDKLKSLCKFCSSHLDKPCAWISLGNEYCDRIMDIQSELNNRIPKENIENLIKDIDRELEILDKKQDDSIIYSPRDICNAEKLRLEELLNKE